jgi:thioesterase domain-containing protein/non-ribosomal peptide synthetase component E (peptide arylation enzyme)/acyl carrier protein
VREAGLAAVIIDGRIETPPLVPTSLPHLDITASIGAVDDQIIALAPANCPAIVLYTSGSTRRPKGICNAQCAISQRVAQYTNTCHLNAADRFILLSSPGTIAGIRDTFAALLNGATLYIADPRKVGMNGIIRMLQDKQITVCYAVPALFRELLTLPDAKQICRHLRIIRLGGDKVLVSDIILWQRLLAESCRLLIGYGSTEAPTAFQWFVPNDWKADGPRVPIGYALPSASIALVNDDGKPAMVGESATLVYKSPYLALGIWQNGRLQPGDFLTSPDDKSVRILHVDDLIRLREDGLAEFVGRKDQVIKIRGQRVDLVEVEEVLRSCDNIADAVVCLRGDDHHPALVAYVVSNASDTQSFAERLKLAVAARLPAYMRPAEIFFLDAIPRLPSLKPDVQALAKLDKVSPIIFGNEPARGMDLSKNGTESYRISDAVEKAWTEVLDRNSFAANLQWDQAGGDSLRALRLWFLIEEALDKRLPLDALDSNTTPRDLIAAIEKLFTTLSLPVVPASDVRPLVFLMPAFEGDSPALVRLRAAFEGKIRFAVAHYPSWREMIHAEGRFDLIIDAVVAQVVATCGENDCLLAGYSFGGFVAWETARRLTESGRHVTFVGLIDSRRADLVNSPKSQSILAKVGRMLRSMYANSRAAHVIVLRSLIRRLIGMPALPILHAMGNLAMLLPAQAAYTFHANLIAEWRLRALRKSEIKPLRVTVTLFRSDEYLSISPDFGWGALCAKLDVVSIGGSHLSLLEPPYRALLCERFLEAVQLACHKPDGASDR